MNRLVASAPYMPDLQLNIGHWLSVKHQGALALPFQETYIKHMLRMRYPRSSLTLALHPFIQILRQENRSEDEISRALDKLRLSAADESTARDFELAKGWAFKRADYERSYLS